MDVHHIDNHIGGVALKTHEANPNAKPEPVRQLRMSEETMDELIYAMHEEENLCHE